MPSRVDVVRRMSFHADDRAASTSADCRSRSPRHAAGSSSAVPRCCASRLRGPSDHRPTWRVRRVATRRANERLPGVVRVAFPLLALALTYRRVRMAPLRRTADLSRHRDADARRARDHPRAWCYGTAPAVPGASAGCPRGKRASARPSGDRDPVLPRRAARDRRRRSTTRRFRWARSQLSLLTIFTGCRRGARHAGADAVDLRDSSSSA